MVQASSRCFFLNMAMPLRARRLRRTQPYDNATGTQENDRCAPLQSRRHATGF